MASTNTTTTLINRANSNLDNLYKLARTNRISSIDLEDLLNTTSYTGGYNLRELSTTSGGTAADNHRHNGSFLDLSDFQTVVDKVLEESYRYMGRGKDSNILQNFMSRLDRHGTALVPPNTLNYGFTFITRPRLNLSAGNLRQAPYFASLASTDQNSVPFMIRGLLDTVLSSGKLNYSAYDVYSTSSTSSENSSTSSSGGSTSSGDFSEISAFANLAATSALLDVKNPFLVPLCNGLKGMSGWPDFTLESETTEGDFHCGDFTFIQGSDMLNKSTELSLEFRDIQGGIVIAIIYYWVLYIAYQAKGLMMAYPDDIYEQRLNYTVSIYRFITDPTRRYVLWWAKATGCFPKSVPIGALFNINQGEVTISSAANYSIPFVANKIEYNHPGILMDFNKLMGRYNSDLYGQNANDNWKKAQGISSVSSTATSSMIEIPYYREGQVNPDIRRLNFMAVPYLVANNKGIELKWYTSSDYCDDDEWTELKKLYGESSDSSSTTTTTTTTTGTTTTSSSSSSSTSSLSTLDTYLIQAKVAQYDQFQSALSKLSSSSDYSESDYSDLDNQNTMSSTGSATANPSTSTTTTTTTT